MEFKTTDLSDNHSDKVSIVPAGLQSYGGSHKFSGEVVTVQVFEDNVLIRKALSEDGRGKVLVVDGGGSLNCALMGDCLATIADQNNWEGIVINGCVRDTQELKNFKVGIRALAAHPKRSGKTGKGKVGSPIEFRGVQFRSGDFLYADQDGIVTSNQNLL